MFYFKRICILIAQLLQVDPKNCLAFEDSYNGALSASRAGMRLVACPDPRLDKAPFYKLTPIVVNILEETKDVEELREIFA